MNWGFWMARGPRSQSGCRWCSAATRGMPVLTEIAKDDEARSAAQKIYETGAAALRADDSETAEQAIEKLDDLKGLLEQEYVVQIVNRPGEPSGVWRIPYVNEQARNYYLIVEAVASSGESLSVPVYNEETGKTDKVKTWGIRVDESTFEAVRRDKQDDGIIQNDRFGEKSRHRTSHDQRLFCRSCSRQISRANAGASTVQSYRVPVWILARSSASRRPASSSICTGNINRPARRHCRSRASLTSLWT